MLTFSGNIELLEQCFSEWQCYREEALAGCSVMISILACYCICSSEQQSPSHGRQSPSLCTANSEASGLSLPIIYCSGPDWGMPEGLGRAMAGQHKPCFHGADKHIRAIVVLLLEIPTDLM